MKITRRGPVSTYRSMPLAARAAFWFAVSGVVQRGLSMLTMPIFTRLMSTEQYGLYSLYNSWLQVLTVVVTLRLTYAVFNKGMSKYPDDRDSYTSTMQGLTSIIGLVCLAVYLVMREWVNALTGLSTLITLAMFCEVLLTPAISFWMARVRYDFEYKPIVLVSLLMAAGNAVLGVLAVLLSEDKASARILSAVLVQVAIGAVLYVRNLKHARPRFVSEHARFALVFNLPLLPHYLSMYALDSFDRIMVAKMVGLSAAALYGVAYNIGLIMKIVTDSISNALVPWQYRKLASGDLQAVEKRWYPVLLFVGVLVTAFIAVAPELVAVLGGSRYADAIYVIPPVAVSIPFILAYTMFANVELHYDANKFMMYGSVVAAVANVGLNYVLIPQFGYLAAAYTTLFCYFGLAVAHYVYMDHVVRTNTSGRRVLHPGRLLSVSGGLILAAGVLTAMYEFTVVRYAMVLAAGVVLVVKRDEVRALVGGVDE